MERARLSKGDKAPFTGQLLSDAAVAKLLADYDAKIKELEIKIKYLTDSHQTKVTSLEDACKVSVNVEAGKKQVCEDSRLAEKLVYTEAINRVGKQAERRWWESPYLHLVLGLSAGVGGCIAATK